MPWYRHDAARGLLTLFVQAQPGARKPGIEPLGDELLKVRVAAPAVEGRANQALCELLAGRLGVARSRVTVVRGANARRKQVEVRIAQFDPSLLCDAESA